MIFYYSATNNSKSIVEEIAERNEHVYSIIEAVQKNEYVFQVNKEEAIGFIIPTYFYGIPNMVEEFIQNLELQDLQENYFYLILTCGLNTANAGGIFQKKIKKGYQINAIYAVKMVDTYVPIHRIPEEAVIHEIIKNAKKDITEIKRHIQKQDKGDFNQYKGKLPNLMSKILYPFYLKGRKTKKFYVTDRCNGCGKCSQNCIRKVIQIENKKPIWKKQNCELCLKCLHQCPQNAIQYGNTKRKGRYMKNSNVFTGW